MEHYTIGTAGHIDHGKTSLTKCLTGVDTDRLQEEKARNISIELGFAPFTLPSGRQVSVIDVPGHERFIRHMVAGVFGIDLVLLVVAADEGVMPQTTEHLHILNLLGITNGVIVLTKTDLVEKDFLELVKEDVRDAIRHTFLAHAPIFETSVVTGEGIEPLKKYLDQVLNDVPARPADGPFQLPVDRVFTLKGVGTIVTGTVYSGTVHVADEIEILPEQLKGKVRHIQVHGNGTEVARAGQRAAINVTQVKKDRLRRGQVLATPNEWSPTARVDAFVRSLPDAPVVKHQTTVSVHIGSGESQAELVLYDRPVLGPGEEAYVSFRLETPIVASRGSRFIFRRPTPSATIGGGEIIRPYAKKLRYRPSSARFLEQLHTSDTNDRIRDLLQAGPLVQHVSEIARQLTETEQHIRDVITELIEAKAVQEILPSTVALTERLEKIVAASVKWLEQYHQQFPMRYGPSRAEWGARFLTGTPNKVIEALLKLWNDDIKTNGEEVAMQAHQPSIPEKLKHPSEQLIQALKAHGVKPEKWQTLAELHHISSEYSIDLLNYLEKKGVVVLIEEDRALHMECFTQAKETLVKYLKQHRTISTQQAKTLFGNLPRKHLIPLLETMDRKGVTRRDNNVRRLA